MDLYSNAPYYITAYGLAVKHGYRGTEQEFVDELMNGAARAAEAAQGSQEAAAASAEAAALSAGAAELDAQSAASDASDAEAYSAGTRSGTAVPETDPAYHNNAAYYAGVAEDYAEHIQDPVSGLVADWLEEHITNPSNPPIDTSLSVANAAADAAAVGGNAILRYPTMITNAQTLSALTGGTNDANDIPSNRIVYVSASAPAFTHQAEIDGSRAGIYLTLYHGSAVSRAGAIQVFICGAGGISTRLNSAGVWGEWIIVPDTAGVSDLIAEAVSGFVAPADTITRYPTMITSEATLSALTGGTKDANDFPSNKIVYVSLSAPTFTHQAAVNGNKAGIYLTLYHGSAVSRAGAIQIFICGAGGIATRLNSAGTWQEWRVIQAEPKIYNVGPTRDHKTLTELWLAIDGDTTPKTVYVDPGEYDVFQEYLDNNVPSPPAGTPTSNYKPYNANIPGNTTLIGLGNVTLKWLPDAESISELESQIWCPVNVHAEGEFRMENFTVICGNGRYCIHDDPHNTTPGCHHTYKNLRLYRPARSANRGFPLVVGMGYADRGRYEFENLVMQNENNEDLGYCIGGHEGHSSGTGGSADGATVVIKDCVMQAVGRNSMRFQTINSTDGAQQRIMVSINNCHLNKRIWLDKYASGSHQFFDLTLLHSGNPEIYIEDQNNPWPPTIYQ